MKIHAKLLLFACLLLVITPCHARTRKPKTRLYRNVGLNFCVYVPADWRGPLEVKNHPGAEFAPPFDPAIVTIGTLSNQPRSTILKQPDAGSQMAALDDYRGATLQEWQNDRTLKNVKQSLEEPATLQQTPALHTVLTYKRDHERWRYEAVFALWNQTQYSIGYDAPKSLAKRYEKRFQEIVRSFEFQCGASEQR